MMNKNYIFIISVFIILSGCKNENKEKEIESDSIQFEISEYNLLFTKIEINKKEHTALIDFGDFADFQISTKLIDELNLKLKNQI